MIAYQLGDVDAFAELVARHEKPLWNFLRRLVRDPATAEDLLQESFMRVVKHGAAWQPNARFSTWLYAIARNLCVDHARKSVHRRALSLDQDSARGDSEAPPVPQALLLDGQRGGEQHALDHELGRQLERAILALPEPQREVFVMREVLELSFAEIAEMVGVGEPTVKSRMRYALEQLRETLSAVRDDPPRVEASP